MACVCHDYRRLNDTIIPDPYPLETIPDLFSFMCENPTHAPQLFYFMVDTDQGYFQIVMEEASVIHTSFEMDGSLWIAMRLIFGLVTGPAVFARNADAFLGDLKQRDRSIRNYFDDLIGKAASISELISLLRTLLLQARREHWKFKPRKLQFGYSRIAVFGNVFQNGTVAMSKKRIGAV